MSISQADLVMMGFDDLKKVAESFTIKTAGQSREQLLEAIQLAAIRKEEDLRHKVVEAKRAESLLGIGLEVKDKHRPSPEDIAILASRKVRVKFINREDAGGPNDVGADVTFLKGSFRFHLYDDRDHILPECLIVEDIREVHEVMEKVVNFFAATGMKKQKSIDAAKGVMRRLSLLISCKNPVYGTRTLQSGETVSQIVRWVPRFEFKISKRQVPKNAGFGILESEVQYA